MDNCEDEKLAFRAIKELVEDLWDLFGNPKKANPLALYRRLINHIDEEEPGPGIQKCVSGFKTFIVANSEFLSNSTRMMKSIPRNSVIYYGDSNSVFLEIQKFLFQAQDENREAIRQHLLTISAILDPNERNLTDLEDSSPILEKMGLNDGSREGDFVSGIMNKAKNTIGSLDDTDDPSVAIMGLFSSGIITDMVKGLQSGVQDGSMDMNRLLTSMQGAMASVIPPSSSGGSTSTSSHGINTSLDINPRQSQSKNKKGKPGKKKK